MENVITNILIGASVAALLLPFYLVVFAVLRLINAHTGLTHAKALTETAERTMRFRGYIE